MNYVPVRVSTLRGDEKINFDLYIPVSDRHVHYIRKGDSFEGERLARLKKKNLKKMYILPEHEKEYQSYIQRNLELAFSKNSAKPIETRAEVAQGASQAAVEEVLDNPGDIASYNGAKETAEKYLGFLSEQSAAVKAVLSIQNTDKNLAHHGVTVATLAVGMAQKLGITDSASLKVLTLGAYLHDLGHSDSSTGHDIPLAQMSPEQIEKYQTHPRLGAQLAQDKKHFEQGVIDIIMQHEETDDGNGYPQKLLANRIDRLARVVGICNAWDRMVTFDGVSKVDALKKIPVEKIGKYPLDHINALKEVVK